MNIYVVHDDAQSADLNIGRPWLDFPHIAYAKIGKRVHIGYRKDELIRNFPIDEEVNPVCLKRLETPQNNDFLLKINAYYDKEKSGKLLFRKGEIVVVIRNPKAAGESTQTQPGYRGPMVVTEIPPSDTYRISLLDPSNGRLYATTAHVSELKAWRSWNEDDYNSSENSDDELGM
ncbi:hypothetical protein AVEN_153445-1 [Araneus ventricosus]|uniref:Uncharacterized protein n=1 Tax=Araneus ventricosus TaxID=182803 RepID=A0A4Y2JGI0_ARAVE|nr:hypothetical protein AVEN_153445-1 [Araneus ventricosus]